MSSFREALRLSPEHKSATTNLQRAVAMPEPSAVVNQGQGPVANDGSIAAIDDGPSESSARTCADDKPKSTTKKRKKRKPGV